MTREDRTGITDETRVMPARTDKGEAVSRLAEPDCGKALLYGVALRLLADRALASAAVRDALHDADIRNADDASLLGRVRARALDRLREDGRRAVVPPALSVDAVDALLAGLSEKSGGEALRRRLIGLSATERQMILSALLDGLSAPELAEKFDLPLAVVRTHLKVALHALAGDSPWHEDAGAESDRERTLLAAEYVLGSLGLEERQYLKREAQRDPATKAAIEGWDRRFTPLIARVPPVALPAMARTEHRHGSDLPSGAAETDAAHSGQLRRAMLNGSPIWKAVTTISFLLAAGLAAIVLMDRVPMAVPVAALLPIGSPEVAFVMEARPNGGLEVLPLHPGRVPPGHALELWFLSSDGSVPGSAGLLPPTGLKLRGESLPRGTAHIEVTLEPDGGSVTGRPSGPVLYSGTLLVPK